MYYLIYNNVAQPIKKVTLNGVCRLCLVMDAPMHNITGSPLQSVYEKLTDHSVTAAIQPVAACYLCYSQLRKCHNLMARAVRAERVLAQLLRSGEVENNEIIKMKSREIIQTNELCVTPLEQIDIEAPGYSPINLDITERPLSQCIEETDTDGLRCIDDSKFEDEEIIDSVVRRNQWDEEIIENDGLMDGEEVNEQTKSGVDIETETSTGSLGIKQDKPEEKEAYVRTCIGYLKFEDSEHIDNVIWRDVHNIENNGVQRGKDIEHKELLEAVAAGDMEAAGAASTGKCEETQAIRQDGILTPAENILETLRTRTIVTEEEASSRNIHVLGITEKDANNEQVLTNSRIYPDTAIRKGSVVNEQTETYAGQKVVQCEICKARFTHKSSLKYHLKIHSGEKPFECEICKARFRVNTHLQNHLKIHTGEKPFQCEICKVSFRQRGNLKSHLIIHTNEKPYECEICKVRFRQKRHLKTHLKIHAREKPCDCEICKVRFRKIANVMACLRKKLH